MKTVNRTKFCFFVLSVVLFPFTTEARQGSAKIENIDADEAKRILKEMSDFMAGLERFSFDAEMVRDVVTTSGQKLTFEAQGEVTVHRPGRVRALRDGEMGMQTVLMFDKGHLVLYGPRRKVYAQAQVPSTLEQAVPHIRKNLGLDLPGADLLLPDIYSRFMREVKSSAYLGECTLEDKPCHHLAFRGKNVDFQLWVAQGKKPVPLQYLITSKRLKGSPDFKVRFHDWDFSPSVSQKKFVFKPPKGSEEIGWVRLSPQQVK